VWEVASDDTWQGRPRSWKTGGRGRLEVEKIAGNIEMHTRAKSHG
jgi:hypothetical protein